jgi:hypothetical protein
MAPVGVPPLRELRVRDDEHKRSRASARSFAALRMTNIFYATRSVAPVGIPPLRELRVRDDEQSRSKGRCRFFPSASLRAGSRPTPSLCDRAPRRLVRMTRFFCLASDCVFALASGSHFGLGFGWFLFFRLRSVFVSHAVSLPLLVAWDDEQVKGKHEVLRCAQDDKHL